MMWHQKIRRYNNSSENYGGLCVKPGTREVTNEMQSGISPLAVKHWFLIRSRFEP